MVYVTDERSGADLRRLSNGVKRLVAMSGKEPTRKTIRLLSGGAFA